MVQLKRMFVFLSEPKTLNYYPVEDHENIMVWTSENSENSSLFGNVSRELFDSTAQSNTWQLSKSLDNCGHRC